MTPQTLRRIASAIAYDLATLRAIASERQGMQGGDAEDLAYERVVVAGIAGRLRDLAVELAQAAEQKQ